MARLAMSIAIGISAFAAASVAAIATAAADPAVDRLEAALPPGWSLLATASELVIRHDRPCYVTGAQPDRAAAAVPGEVRGGKPMTAAPGGGPLVTIELRYRLEPRWTPGQLASAKAANDQIAGELRTLAAHYRIDAIHAGKGAPQPANADEQQRLAAYEAGRARLTARLVKLPHCTLGDAAVFDGEATYAQLTLEVDPPEVMTQAHRILELMKQHCR